MIKTFIESNEDGKGAGFKNQPEEMNNPYKHLFFNDEPMMIDFERARIADKPKMSPNSANTYRDRLKLDYKKLIPLIKNTRRIIHLKISAK